MNDCDFVSDIGLSDLRKSVLSIDDLLESFGKDYNSCQRSLNNEYVSPITDKRRESVQNLRIEDLDSLLDTMSEPIDKNLKKSDFKSDRSLDLVANTPGSLDFEVADRAKEKTLSGGILSETKGGGDNKSSLISDDQLESFFDELSSNYKDRVSSNTPNGRDKLGFSRLSNDFRASKRESVGLDVFLDSLMEPQRREDLGKNSSTCPRDRSTSSLNLNSNDGFDRYRNNFENIRSNPIKDDTLDELINGLTYPDFKADNNALESKKGDTGNILNMSLESISNIKTSNKSVVSDPDIKKAELDELIDILGNSSVAPCPSEKSFTAGFSRVNDSDKGTLGANGSSDISIRICNYCNQRILSESISISGKFFHTEHFLCNTCNIPLGTGKVYQHENLIQCEGCFQVNFCPRCIHCNLIIKDNVIEALDSKWHVDCFVCSHCKNPFENYLSKDGRPYCETCYYQVFSARCRSCGLPVSGDYINALGSQWHPEHFNCQKCHIGFSETFFEFEGLPYCKQHYHEKNGSLCASCKKSILGVSINALGQKWHPEHFVCSFCIVELVEKPYKDHNGKPYCKYCSDKLFNSS